MTAFENATISITPGSEHAFERAVAGVADVFSQGGARSLSLLRCHEVQSRYLLVVEWESVEAHMSFRETPLFAQWRAAVSEFFAEQPSVEHFHPIDLS